MSAARRIAAVATVGLVAGGSGAGAGCGDNAAAPTIGERCALGTSEAAATVEGRYAIGPAAPYVPDLGLAAREAELARDPAARRAAAWAAVARVTAPVPLGEPRLAANFGGAQPEVATWATWYAQDDFARSFKHAYRALTPAARRARAAIDVDGALAWNATDLATLPDWPEQRYLDYLGTIADDRAANGVAGANRVSYSPGALRHLLASYAREDACRIAPADPPADAPGPTRPGHDVEAVETAALAACGVAVFGPYVAAPGTAIAATTEVAGVEVLLRRGAPPTLDTFDCASDAGACALDASDVPVYVGVVAAEPTLAAVHVRYATADVAEPTCLAGAMPRDAAIVKADWRRVLPGQTLPVFDTSPARMTARLAAADPTWDAEPAEADPARDAIYTVTTEQGETFRMPALHVMTKELDHWLWVTLWWSPRPDEDFGADRPSSIGGVWRNYKMCVATDYLDGGAPSWCSNPYLELGAGNAATNCIGCHQHGGTALLPEQILATQPAHGRTRVRDNFFTDYSWAIKGGGGEELSAIVQAEIDFWDATDPP